MWHICNLLLTARQCRPVTVTAFSAWLAVDEIIISPSIHLHLYLIPLSGKNADSWFSYIITPPAFCIFITVDVLASSSSSAQNASIPVFVSSALTVPHDPVMCCFLRRLFRNRLSSASTRNSSELTAFPRPLGICTQCKSSWSGGQSCCSMGRPQWLWHAGQSRTPFFFFSWMSFLLSSYIQSLFFFFLLSSSFCRLLLFSPSLFIWEQRLMKALTPIPVCWGWRVEWKQMKHKDLPYSAEATHALEHRMNFQTVLHLPHTEVLF